MTMNNDNFKHIQHIIDKNISNIQKYIKSKTKIYNPLSPEQESITKHRLNYKYKIGDYTWYIPDKINNIQPFLAIRCTILEVYEKNDIIEYIVDEPIATTLKIEQMYPDITHCFAELQRIFYFDISKYSMQEYSKYILEDTNLIFAQEDYVYQYDTLKKWRQKISKTKIIDDDNILTVKKQKLIDWYNIQDFEELNLLYYDT